MIGSVDPFAGRGKARLRGTVLLGSAAPLLVHFDHKTRHRLGVLADLFDVLVGQRFGVLSKQLPTARDRNRVGFVIVFFDKLHGGPLNASRGDACWWVARSGASMCHRRADVQVSADAGLEPASSRRSCAPSGDDREWFDRPLRSVSPALMLPLVNAFSAQRVILRMTRGERYRDSQLN